LPKKLQNSRRSSSVSSQIENNRVNKINQSFISETKILETISESSNFTKRRMSIIHTTLSYQSSSSPESPKFGRLFIF